MYLDKLKNVVIPFVLVSVVTLPLVFVDKGTHVLTINRWHTDFLDIFFTIVTILGDGLTLLLYASVLLVKFKRKYLYEFLIAFLIQATLVLMFKRVVFVATPRPYKFFQNLHQEHLLNVVEGIRINLYDSFPSGHTATAFFIAMYFALMFNKLKCSVVVIIFASFVGLSRIYLLQHFFIDVYFGMLFGIIAALLAHYIVNRKEKSWYDKLFFKGSKSMT